MMKQSKLISKLALKSMKSHKRIFGPFILASLVLFALEYIILSLTSNRYVIERSPDLIQILLIGVFFATLLNIIIVIYASSFVRKQLTQEYGVYSVLGLEKKHVRRIAGRQFSVSFLITAVASIVLGYLTGSFLFVLFNRLMRDTGAGLMDYPFDWVAALITLGIMAASFLIMYVLAAHKIRRLNALELLKDNRKGQGEVKFSWFVLLVCIVTLAAGYYLTLTTRGVLDSLGILFLAILLVMVGTFAFFYSFLIFILKLMKANKNYYYQSKHFLSVAGMLQRVRKNASSLSSISILASGVILVLSMTLSTYQNMERLAEGSLLRDYEIRANFDELPAVEQREKMTNLQVDLVEAGLIDQAVLSTRTMAPAFVDGNQIEVLKEYGKKQAMDNGQPIFLLLGLKKDYQALFPEESVAEDAWVIASNLMDVSEIKELKILGQKQKVQLGNKRVISSTMGTEMIYLGLDNLEQLADLYQALHKEDTPLRVSTNMYFDLKEGQSEEQAQTIVEGHDFSMVIKEEQKRMIYQLNGGLLFIGLVVSSVLLIGTILMLYFKQVAEGYEDRVNFRIMKQVGLPQNLIKKTIRSQVLWIFFLPLLVAVIHNGFASRIVFKSLGLLGVFDFNFYLNSFLLVVGAFIVFYLVFYYLTSRTYYQLVNQD